MVSTRYFSCYFVVKSALHNYKILIAILWCGWQDDWDSSPSENPFFVTTRSSYTNHRIEFEVKRARMFISYEEVQEHGRIQASTCSSPQVGELFLCKQSCGNLCSLRLGQHGLCMLNFSTNQSTGYFWIQYHD